LPYYRVHTNKKVLFCTVVAAKKMPAKVDPKAVTEGSLGHIRQNISENSANQDDCIGL
jgi:hypothetical protein